MSKVPSAGSDLVLTRSLQVDVNGQPRSEPVHVPAYLKGGRPAAVPNIKVINCCSQYDNNFLVKIPIFKS